MPYNLIIFVTITILKMYTSVKTTHILKALSGLYS